MAAPVDRPTRVASDLLDSAAAEGARQSRSAKQQLDHWARLGREVSSQDNVSRRRVEAALSGQLSMRELTPEEGVVFNAEIEVELERRIAATHLQDELRAEGMRVVILNDAGEIVQYPPA
ncbi:Uncharacterized protein conserved in bacteria [Mycobacteroides abscessus subsp. abscessus]|uniref:TA system antitoxin ParD family protein n=1 Tax=Mycobacteroides abscessus TaxID=36809 RepID=UPI00092901C3|nr:hypothetical protein [Mycobacteroides abscessus]SHX96999.1 Uncharacterized protein conserved in bacteria [Mycobacteroides abscessus subsp. abscessus]SIC78087.1 Uncharacterized protein conserved in bacteria [Mycobacteroides abscessus subsp. abscessus]SKP27503.1 Uncharacterized protein conserved in bacteria [Mycobacteroides abscessus subsp. abscessus]SKU62113.1 Uncharacterized protein conserved in bacteria [Mycobacteroides abscessus subsp. massiliense]